MRLSVICPAYNEENYIDAILQHFIESYPDDKELYIIDGGSTDRTVAIVHEWSRTHPDIHLIHNPDKFVPYALNLAIPLCKGEYIVRIDAHTEYASDYYESILDFKKSIQTQSPDQIIEWLSMVVPTYTPEKK